MAISEDEAKSLSRHFVSSCRKRNLSDEDIVALLPIKGFQTVKYWMAGAGRMQKPSVEAIRKQLAEWHLPEDPTAMVNAYFAMSKELSIVQRWDLVKRIMADLEDSCLS